MTDLAAAPVGELPPQPRRWSGILAIASFALLIASLGLPAVEVTVVGAPVELAGVAAAWFALCWGVTSLPAILAHQSNASDLAAFVAVGASALANVVFLLPAPWLKKTRARAPSRRAVGFWAVGTGLAIVSPRVLVLTGMHLRLLSGYGLWLAAWLALGAALLAAWREALALRP